MCWRHYTIAEICYNHDELLKVLLSTLEQRLAHTFSFCITSQLRMNMNKTNKEGRGGQPIRI
jgi:hypothetical protein